MRRLIRAGEHKKALARAKHLHRRHGSTGSEALLIDAYIARIDGLSAAGLVREARALADTVAGRHPAARRRLEERRVSLSVELGDVDDLLRSLADPATPPGRRELIRGAIRRRLTDPSIIARSDHLPPDHPLKRAANALAEALDAVTSRRVEDREIALPEVSRRSPLASWKLLIRAIACFHRLEDEACERFLQALEGDGPPARLVPVLRAMMRREGEEKLRGAGARLAARVAARAGELERALRELDKAMSGGRRSDVYRAMGAAVKACEREAPDLLAKLKQHISIRAWMAELPAERVRETVGESLKDAYFWRLFARAAERKRLWLPAASLWEEFGRNAIAQVWFRKGGREEAALYLHMAELMRRYDRRNLKRIRSIFLSQFQGYGEYYRDQPPEVQAASPENREEGDPFYFAHPDRLYERACAIDPDPETFRMWLEWVRSDGGHWREADAVALAWHRAVPGDLHPLLHLVESAERRNAFKKALGYLKEAERLDGLHSEVRRVRFRLILATTRRHLAQGKHHLARKDLEVLESLPRAGERDRPILTAALRWACSAIADDRAGAEAWRKRVVREMGGPTGALVLRATAKSCRLPPKEWPALPGRLPTRPEGGNAAAVARACALGRDVGIPIEIPRAWHDVLAGELSDPGCRVDLRSLRCLAETALDGDGARLCFTASGVGLARKGGDAGRFLLLRARSLPLWCEDRRRECAVAAAEIARRQGDGELLEEAVAVARRRVKPLAELLSSQEASQERTISVPPEEVRQVIEREGAEKEFPEPEGAAPPPWAVEEDEGDEEPPEFEGPDMPFDPEDLLRLPDRLGMELMEGILEAVQRHADVDGEPPDLEEFLESNPEFRSLVERVLRELAGGRRAARGNKRGKTGKRGREM